MQKLSFVMDPSYTTAIEMPSDYVDAKSLAANVAETFTKPVGARFVRLTGNLVFYFNPRGTAVAPTDINNGSASVAVPAGLRQMFCVDEVASISVVAPATTLVTAEWWE